MSTFAFEIVARQIGFDSEDVRYIQELVPLIRSEVDEVVDHLYGRLLAEPRFGDSFSSDPARLDQLRDMFKDWLIDMLGGEYDECYWKNRSSFIRAHLQVDFAQQYITVGLEILRQELNRIIRQSGGPKVEAGIESFHKLLTIEAVAILESYKELYAAHVRRKERSMAEEQLTQSEHMAQLGQLAASLAHEIKNPLTPIRLAVQQMKNKYRENDPAFGPLLFQSVDIIEEEVATLSRLVSDFSAFAKLPRVSPEPVELAAFLADCRSSLDYMGGQKNIDIVFEMPDERIVVDMDVMMMKRVMDNLVRNAAEALADADVTGPRVRISARTTGAKGKKEAQIRIEDNGPGIRPEHHPSIFEPYFTTKEEGTGLGLAIAKKIVLDHNGTIRIDETRPSGACFIVQLPVAAGAKAAAKEERA